MKMHLAPWLVLALVAAVTFAILYDLAAIAGHALRPWFGWMLP